MCVLCSFKIDQNYVGEPPAIEITITNLNDNIDKQFLSEMLQKCGPTEDVTIYYHPSTKRHLGLARIVFVDVKSARACIDKMNGTSVMGNELNVYHDAFGEDCKRIIDDITHGRKPTYPSAQRSNAAATVTAVAAVVAANPTAPVVNSIPFMEDAMPSQIARINDLDAYRSHSKPDTEDSWSNSNELSRDVGSDYRHSYRSDKKDSRKWDNERKHHHYHYKGEKERERRDHGRSLENRERDRDRDRDRDRRERDR